MNAIVEGFAAHPRHRGARVMMPGIMARYFGMRFFGVFVGVFGSLFLMVLMIDYVEMLRRTGNLPHASFLDIFRITFYRVPHVTERIMPFTALIAAMVCYLSLSRRLELVIARSAGVSAWQFVTAGDHYRAADRHLRNHDLQSRFRQHARTVAAL